MIILPSIPSWSQKFMLLECKDFLFSFSGEGGRGRGGQVVGQIADVY